MFDLESLKTSLLSTEVLLAAITIILSPTTWTIVARIEFKTKFFSKFVGDNVIAADCFAMLLIEMGIFRSYCFYNAVTTFNDTIDIPAMFIIPLYVFATCLVVWGLILNIMVVFRIGIHGIYYGDYFGILGKEICTKFPFSVASHPLYIGSTLVYLGDALLCRSLVGLLLTFLAYFMYHVVSILEAPVTILIYSDENIKKVNLAIKEKEEQRERRRMIMSN